MEKKNQSLAMLPCLAIIVMLVFIASNVSAQLISIKSAGNSKYVRVHTEGTSSLLASRTGIGTRCVYALVDLGSGVVALKSYQNNLYVTPGASPAYELQANASSIGTNQKFDLAAVTGGYYSLKAHKNNKYVTTVSGGTYPLRALSSSVGTWEKFVLTDRVDMWWVMNAFHRYFPNSVKDHVLGTLKVHKEKQVGNYIYMYEVFDDDRWDPIGAPVWNKYGLQWIGDWEVFTSWATWPEYATGSTWNVPRCVRYADPYSTEYTPHVTDGRYNENLNMNCGFFWVSNAEEWGKQYESFEMDLSNEDSDEDMGTRWVMEVEYKDTGEYWIVDLGPEEGDYSPRYGVVYYNNGIGTQGLMTNIQSDHHVYDMRCGY